MHGTIETGKPVCTISSLQHNDEVRTLLSKIQRNELNEAFRILKNIRGTASAITMDSNCTILASKVIHHGTVPAPDPQLLVDILQFAHAHNFLTDTHVWLHCLPWLLLKGRLDLADALTKLVMLHINVHQHFGAFVRIAQKGNIQVRKWLEELFFVETPQCPLGCLLATYQDIFNERPIQWSYSFLARCAQSLVDLSIITRVDDEHIVSYRVTLRALLETGDLNLPYSFVASILAVKQTSSRSSLDDLIFTFVLHLELNHSSSRSDDAVLNILRELMSAIVKRRIQETGLFANLVRKIVMLRGRREQQQSKAVIDFLEHVGKIPNAIVLLSEPTHNEHIDDVVSAALKTKQLSVAVEIAKKLISLKLYPREVVFVRLFKQLTFYGQGTVVLSILLLLLRHGRPITRHSQELILSSAHIHKDPTSASLLLSRLEEQAEEQQASRLLFYFILGISKTKDVIYCCREVWSIVHAKRKSGEKWKLYPATFTPLLAKCKNVQDVRQVKKVAEQTIEGGRMDKTWYNALIHAYARLGEPELAEREAKTCVSKKLLVADNHTYNSLISAWGDAKLYWRALKWYEWFRDVADKSNIPGFGPCIVTYNALIWAVMNSDDFHNMEKGGTRWHGGSN